MNEDTSVTQKKALKPQRDRLLLIKAFIIAKNPSQAYHYTQSERGKLQAKLHAMNFDGLNGPTN